MRPCSGGVQYTPRFFPALPLPEPPQWVYTPLSHPVNHAYHPPHCSVVETLKGFLKPGGQYPSIRPKYKHRLHHHHINLPVILLSAPSLPKNFASLPHFPCALCRFCSTTGKLLSDDDNVRTKYSNEGTLTNDPGNSSLETLYLVLQY